MDTATFSIAENLVSGGTDLVAQGVSPDGRTLLYREVDPKEGIWTLALDQPNAKPLLFAKTNGGAGRARFSPDGRWVAYESTESARLEIFVQPYPTNGVRFQISAAGGSMPRWSHDGRELHYVSNDGDLMSVTVTPGPRPVFSPSKPLFRSIWPNTNWDISPDGNRILRITAAPPTAVTNSETFGVILNWRSSPQK